ncbi:aminotransferase class I/II-fold pyridoxal phosphate-dependent enzyme [Glaciibacter sp. 2TAF33]|uniref:aminotransferase class I/II-fold pyridoxal phosphate-dependent enzyme n=1 Tax=Glaciibacter sp. 2TAF33 TaxID=3233015 RepID=UPI003F8F058E
MERNDAPPATETSSDWLAARIEEPSALGIAAAIIRLVRQGEIASGCRLPTVRDLAVVLHVSPATVSAAWATLRKHGVIEGTGRQGTRVLDAPRMLAPKRFENVVRLWGGSVLDLSLATPDPALLPSLQNAIARAPIDERLNWYQRPSIIPALRDAVAPTWPWQPEAWFVANGGYDGIRLLVASGVVPGEYVAVADPSTPRTLDILELFGARVLPVKTDADGPQAESLRHALKSRPVAFIYEPRSGSRSGSTLSAERHAELAAVLDGTDCLIIEDDGLGDLNLHPGVSLGTVFPDRSVVVRSYSKSHGPDLRTAVMGGAELPIERARLYQQFGAGWTSRMLQGALAWMLTDADTRARVDHARQVYKGRRVQMATLLGERGLNVKPRDGLSLVVPLLSEQQGLLVLASYGIATETGREGSILTHSPVARLGIGQELADPERVADAYAMAARAL